MESSVNVSCCILKYGFAIFGNILAYLFLTTLNLVGNNFRISDCLFSGGTNFRSLQENLREAWKLIPAKISTPKVYQKLAEFLPAKVYISSTVRRYKGLQS